MPKAPPSFQFYPADFLSDENVVLMSNEQVGCYIKLLCYCWREGSIPNDMEFIARLCGVANGENMATLWQKNGGISKCFQQDGTGRLYNRRLRLEREKQVAYQKRQSRSGKKGAMVRWDKGSESQDKNSGAIKSPMAKNSSSSSSIINIVNNDSFKFKKSVPIPSNIFLTDRMKAYVEKQGANGNYAIELFEAFKNWHGSKGRKYQDWTLTFYNWVLKDKKDIHPEKYVVRIYQ